jgi:hypothetical protein
MRMGKDNAINPQLALPLDPRMDADSALRNAWARTRLNIPYQVAIHVPALAICLRNMAAAETRRKIRRMKRARMGPRIDFEWPVRTREGAKAPASRSATQ